MELHYISLGSGKPLLILHGLLGSHINWLGMGKRLAEWYSVYLIDLRNHGLSPHSEDMSYPHMASDVGNFIRSQRLEKPVLMGHSMGGKVAMEYSLANPESVESLIVLDIAPKAYPPTHENVFPALLDLDLKKIHSRREADELLTTAIPDSLLRMFLLKNLKRDNEGRFQWQVNIEALGAHYDKIWAAIEPGRVCEKDTLFIRGGNSSLVLDNDVPAIKEMFPMAAIETIAGAGHWLHTDKPEDLLRILRNFLG